MKALWLSLKVARLSSRKAKHKRKIGLAIKSSLLKHLPDVPTNEWLMKLCFPLNVSCHIIDISTYALTPTSDELKGTFYEDFNNLGKAVPTSDMLMLLGDSNEVGIDYTNWKGVPGPLGTGNMNASALPLLHLCAENNLRITNTLSWQADKSKLTWIHPTSKQWHLTMLETSELPGPCEEQNAGPVTILSGSCQALLHPPPIRRNSSSSGHHST